MHCYKFDVTSTRSITLPKKRGIHPEKGESKASVSLAKARQKGKANGANETNINEPAIPNSPGRQNKIK